MSPKFTVRDPHIFLRKYCLLSLILNICLLPISVFYYLGFRHQFYGQILGILFIFVIFFNLGLLIFSDKYLEKKRLGNIGKKTHFLTYIYLIFLIVGLWTFISRKGEFLLYSFSIIIFYIIVGFSICIAILNRRLLDIKESQVDITSPGKGIKILKVLLGTFCILFYFVCFLMAWALLTGGPHLLGIVTGSAISLTVGIFILAVPAVTILFARLFSSKAHRKIKTGIIIVGLVFTGVFALPFVSTPLTIYDADNQFKEHFGTNWNKFGVDVEEHFMDMHFVFGQLYFGMPAIDEDNYKVSRDKTFAKTSAYELKYDVYYPKEKGLPGEDTTIIYIHGGGWSSGDKGQHPYLLKYIASQGYHLYDIQYRLLEINFVKELSGIDVSYMPPDENVVGQYTIEDQISDIAKFTRYLHENNDYDANLDNVIFMGGSAGAHLAALASFGYNENHWNFSRWLNITGTVLFFPADDAEYFFYDLGVFYENGFIPGDKTPKEDPELYEKYTPSRLVDDDDPPCIIFHGTSDQLVPFKNGETIHKRMLKEDNVCILVKGYFGAHGHTEGIQYLTVAMYYMERFLYLVKEG